jgi:DnaJ-class molecular chaperone
MSYGFGFDPEVPAGYQDADIEMAELADRANRMCTECDSTGWVKDWMSLGGEKPCPECGGAGVIE